MSSLVPNRFLFKFEFPLLRAKKPLPVTGDVDAWGERYLLPALCTLDGQTPIGEVFAAWSSEGLYVACRVSGKKRAPRCDPATFRQSDCLRVMTDMRDTRDIRRATRFCQQFFFLPTGGGSKQKDACGGSSIVARAIQNAPLAAARDLIVASKVSKTGYSLTAHIPAASLVGFDPAENPRIGLFYMLEDTELGQQSLTVGDDLNWWMDPSTWPTAVLQD